MNNLLVHIRLLGINTWVLNLLFFFFAAIFIAMIAIMLSYLYIKSVRAKRKLKWEPAISSFLQEIIFLEVNEHKIIPPSISALLNKKAFRRYMASEIRKTKASLSGEAALNLVRLYKRLNLDKDVLNKLNSSKWHIKVQAIKELAAMEQEQYSKKIYHYTNHRNQSLRVEAQCALVDMHGFSGLRFLNVTTHSLSEWQQLLLLHKLLPRQSDEGFAIGKWLHSEIDTIVCFALKLAGHYQCYELHNSVVQCLDHSSAQVRLEAVKCLRAIFMEVTTEELLNHWKPGTKQYEILFVDSLQGYRPRIEINFLLEQLQHTDDDIKFAAAKVLYTNIPGGTDILNNYPGAGAAPWNQIIAQLKNEKAA